MIDFRNFPHHVGFIANENLNGWLMDGFSRFWTLARNDKTRPPALVPRATQQPVPIERKRSTVTNRKGAAAVQKERLVRSQTA